MWANLLQSDRLRHQLLVNQSVSQSEVVLNCQSKAWLDREPLGQTDFGSPQAPHHPEPSMQCNIQLPSNPATLLPLCTPTPPHLVLTTASAESLVCSCCKNLEKKSERFILCLAQNMLQAGLIVAGWDKREGGSVYALPLGGTLIKVPFSIGAP